MSQGLAFFKNQDKFPLANGVSEKALDHLSSLLHVLCPDQDPSVPTLGTKSEDTTCPFHFSLPLDFDKTPNESFLLSRIHVSGLFYLLGCLCPLLSLLSCPLPSQDLLGFLLKDSLPCHILVLNKEQVLSMQFKHFFCR